MYSDVYDTGGLIEATYATQADLAGIYGLFFNTSTHTQSAPNTAEAIEFDSIGLAQGVTLSSNTQVRIQEAGTYHIDFSAQVESSSASDKTIWFWPRINNVDVPGSTMIYTLHNNNSSHTVSRSAVFSFEKGDYLEAMWAVDDVSAFLGATAATAFAPAAPSATLGICRVGAA
jgi:hypothetical protein